MLRQTFSAASAFNIPMARPTAKSGIALLQKIVVMPAAIIATFASASFLADKYAASTRLF